MYYELFRRGPEVYVPWLLLSIAITVALYSAAPIVFAKIRKKQIPIKKYRYFCHVFNFIVAVIFALLNDDTASSFAPCILWTWIFSQRGEKILAAKGVLIEHQTDEQSKKTSSKKRNTTPTKHKSEDSINHKRTAIIVSLISAFLIPLLCLLHIIAEEAGIGIGTIDDGACVAASVFYITNDIIAFIVAPIVCVCAAGAALYYHLKSRKEETATRTGGNLR